MGSQSRVRKSLLQENVWPDIPDAYQLLHLFRTHRCIQAGGGRRTYSYRNDGHLDITQYESVVLCSVHRHDMLLLVRMKRRMSKSLASGSNRA